MPKRNTNQHTLFPPHLHGFLEDLKPTILSYLHSSTLFQLNPPAYQHQFTYRISKCTRFNADNVHLATFLLLKSIRNNYIEIVSLLLTDGRADPNSAFFKPGFCLRYCMAYGQLDMLEMLLKDGRADPCVMVFDKCLKIDDEHENRDIHALLDDDQYVHGPVDVISDMLRSGAERRYESVEMLLKDGRFDPSVFESNCLKLCGRYGDSDVVALLLEDGRVDPRAQGSACFVQAVAYGYAEIVKLLLKDGRVDMNVAGKCLTSATSKGYYDVVDLLLKDDRVKPMFDEILESACWGGFYKIVDLILKDGRMEDVPGSCFLLAAKGGKYGVMALLLKGYVSSNVIVACFESACDMGHYNIVALLLKDKRFKPKWIINGLNIAVLGGKEDVVRMLLKYRQLGSTNIDYSGWLSIAASKGYSSIVSLLLQDGCADPSEDDGECLLTAIKGGHHGIVTLLLEDGRADPSENNSIALVHAVKNGHIEIALSLLQDGRVDTHAKNNICLDISKRMGYDEIVDALEDNQMQEI